MWRNFLSLLPATLLTLLTIAVAFLRFYDEQDFTLLGQIAQPRLWSNRLTLAALVVAVVNFGVEWNRRNRETNRLAQEDQRRSEDATRAENERIERRDREIQRDRAADRERERSARRARIQNRGLILQIRYQLQPSEANRRALNDFLAFLQEYGE